MNTELAYYKLSYIKYYLEVFPSIRYKLDMKDSFQRHFLKDAFENGLPLAELSEVFEIPMGLRHFPFIPNLSLDQATVVFNKLGPSTFAQTMPEDIASLQTWLITLYNLREHKEHTLHWVAVNLETFNAAWDKRELKATSRVQIFRYLDDKPNLKPSYSVASLFKALVEPDKKRYEAQLEAERLNKIKEAEEQRRHTALYKIRTFHDDSLYAPHIPLRVDHMGYTIRLMNTEADFVHLGSRLNNCIGRHDYWRQAVAKKGHMFSVSGGGVEYAVWMSYDLNGVRECEGTSRARINHREAQEIVGYHVGLIKQAVEIAIKGNPPFAPKMDTAPAPVSAREMLGFYTSGQRVPNPLTENLCAEIPLPQPQQTTAPQQRELEARRNDSNQRYEQAMRQAQENVHRDGAWPLRFGG